MQLLAENSIRMPLVRRSCPFMRLKEATRDEVTAQPPKVIYADVTTYRLTYDVYRFN